jgi:hypothetical protein
LKNAKLLINLDDLDLELIFKVKDDIPYGLVSIALKFKFFSYKLKLLGAITVIRDPRIVELKDFLIHQNKLII